MHSQPRMLLLQAFLTLSLLPAVALAGPPAALTTDNGAPVGSNQNSKVAGPHGGVLLEDFHLIEKLARFDRERIPERVVHARAARLPTVISKSHTT